MVIQGDATDGDLLTNENIERTDVFCALTNDDEANIMSSMLAKRLGARKVMTLISKPAYVDLVQEASLTSRFLLSKPPYLSWLMFAGAMWLRPFSEARRRKPWTIAHGDSHSKVVGRRLDEIAYLPGASIGFVRGDDVLIAHDSVVVESDDHAAL